MSVPDNYSAFEARERQADAWLSRQPKCEECKEAIQDDYLYDVDGCLYCEECMKKLFRKNSENYEK